MRQPRLIQQIINVVRLKPNAHLPPTPAVYSYILKRDENAPPFASALDFRSIIGMINYLEKGTRSDIGYATHQCAKFNEDPRTPHAKAVEHIVNDLQRTCDKGIILKPDTTKSLEVFVDADFSGNWYKETAQHDASTAKSRTGFIIMYAGCPVVWCSKLQTEVTLSTTEVEYISLSHALREAIPLINLLQEIQDNHISTVSKTPTAFCKAFEDNSGALELAKSRKLRPRTKHINLP